MDELDPIGTRLMTSTPQAMATSTTPDADQAGGQVGGLLRRAALGVDGGGGGAEREAGAEPRGAADVERLLADLAHAAADDLADLGGVDAGALDEPRLHGAEQVGGVHGGQAAVAAPDGRADGFDDHDVSHGPHATGTASTAVGGAPDRSPVTIAADRLEDEQQEHRADEGHEDRAEVEVVETSVSSPVANRNSAPPMRPPRMPTTIVTRQPRCAAPVTQRAKRTGDEPHDDPPEDAHRRRTLAPGRSCRRAISGCRWCTSSGRGAPGGPAGPAGVPA